MRVLIKCIPWILSRYKKSRDQAKRQPLFLLKKSSSHWTPMNWKQMCTEKQAFPYERGEQLKNRTDVSLSTSLFCLHVIRQVNCVKCVFSESLTITNTHLLLSGCPAGCIMKMDVSGMIQKMLFAICRYATYTFNWDSEMLSKFTKENAQTFPILLIMRCKGGNSKHIKKWLAHWLSSVFVLITVV